LYRNNPAVTQSGASFQSVTCYSSVDLDNWRFEGDVLTANELMKYGNRTWVGRLGVAYINQLNKYALLVQHGNQVLIAVADAPAGVFTWH